jgi:hypothetical protein
MTIFADSEALLGAVFASAVGETVGYARGETSLSLTAWRSPGPATFGVDQGGGVLVEFESWEWHLVAGVLGDFGVPAIADRITAADGRVYEVVAPPGGQCYVGDTVLRIHTKRVEA